MKDSIRIFTLIKAFLYGTASYLIGGLLSMPFEQIRTNTILSPRVTLIVVGVGGLFLALLLGNSKIEDIVRFVVKAIVSYLGVILVGLIIILPMTLKQDTSIFLNILTIVIPTIAYGTLFGVQAYGFSFAIQFSIISCLTAIPIALISAIYHFQNNIPLELNSLWLYAALGAAIAVSVKYLSTD